MYEREVKYILESIRGEREQKQMDVVLGLSVNTYHRLESGHKVFRLQNFLDFSNDLKSEFDLSKAFKDALNMDGELSSAQEILPKFFKIWGEPSSQFVSNMLGMSESKWWRIKNNRTSISLNDFLAILEYRSGKLSHFIEVFSNEFDKVTDDNSYSKVVRYLTANPDFPLLTSAICLQSNRFSSEESLDSFLIRKSGLAEERYFYLKKNLIDLGVIEYDLESDSARVIGEKLEFRTNEREIGIHVFRYITGLAVENSNDMFHRRNYMIRPVSEEARIKIKTELIDSYRNIQSILEDDEASEKSEIVMFSQMLLKNIDLGQD